MSALYTHKYRFEVQCNLVIRKVLYAGENRRCVGSRLLYISVRVFSMNMEFQLLSNVCIWSTMFLGILCTFLSIDIANYICMLYVYLLFCWPW